MNLAQFSAHGFDRGRPAVVEAAWQLVAAFAFLGINPFNWTRVAALRMFGARLGRGVVVKPRCRVKFPWRLEVGDASWIGEAVWIDNLAPVRIGASSCVSQGAYLCTGNHDWRRETFDLTAAPIAIGDEVWIGARAVIGPGVSIAKGSIVTLGTVVTRTVSEASICRPGETAVERRARSPAAAGEPARTEHA